MSAAQDIHEACWLASPSYRLQCQGVRIDGGKPLDFEQYPFIPYLIDLIVPRITVIKGAQMGFTVAAILKALSMAERGKELGLRGIGYWFPTSGEAQVFSKARFTPLMEQNPHIWNPNEISIDSAELKRIGDVALYLRGAGQRGGTANKSTSAVKSIPLDVNIRDEADEMDALRKDAIDHRLDSSEVAMTLDFSTPTFPGYGVDLDYQASNQSSWKWRCPKCNGWTCLEDKYPDCIAEPGNGDPFYLCMKCREPLRREKGEWVARKPEIADHVGLWISQLSSLSRTAADIVGEANKAAESGRQREFWNQVIARAYADVDEQITEDQLTALVRNEPKPLRHEGPSAMGVDPGGKHHYEVRVRVTERDTVQIDRGVVDSYEELSRIAKKHNVRSGVMDKGFDPSAVARFCEDHPGWYGCRYVEAKTSDPDWDHKAHEVKVGRTRLLDDAHNDIIGKHVSFYQMDEFWHSDFVPQMTNLKRATIEHPETGDRKGRWVVTGGQKNDHLRHAGAYCWLASQRVGLAKSVQQMVTRETRQRNANSRRPRSAMVM